MFLDCCGGSQNGVRVGDIAHLIEDVGCGETFKEDQRRAQRL
jgi:hypothetical protein